MGSSSKKQLNSEIIYVQIERLIYKRNTRKKNCDWALALWLIQICEIRVRVHTLNTMLIRRKLSTQFDLSWLLITIKMCNHFTKNINQNYNDSIVEKSIFCRMTLALNRIIIRMVTHRLVKCKFVYAIDVASDFTQTFVNKQYRTGPLARRNILHMLNAISILVIIRAHTHTTEYLKWCVLSFFLDIRCCM